ncbi:glycosyltransferase [Herbidospora mongoliensis]|uniref:glycosyltransferase n=1 Tax=Herbidospora mongoliensis TaxID=688067 RepID=UPI0008360996|nr:glycosyltransferase [Herbidospora mongoliensis]
MRVLLSTIGSRGDVQPLVALATELRALGQEVHLCVPPDFRGWIESLGMPVTPIGPELRTLTAAAPPTTPPSPETLRRLAEASVTTQFETVMTAAKDCDLIVAATAIQVAARSVAEVLKIPYVFTAFCPVVLPSQHHSPVPAPGRPPTAGDNRELWAQDAARFTTNFGPALNSHRTTLGLTPVTDVRSHIFTDHPLLAADPTMAPWPEPGTGVVETGAWLLPDDRPLPDDVLAFLDAGEPPVYFGFGSIRAPRGLAEAMLAAARATGRRAILSRGWADLLPGDPAPDVLSISEINQQALFPRVAAVVHHGGAGTTTAAARAGSPQVVVPQVYDQFYWAQQVQNLGVGIAHPPGTPTAESLTVALSETLWPDIAVNATDLAGKIRTDGATTAANHLLRLAQS